MLLLEATIQINLPVREDSSFQNRVAAELRKHADYLEQYPAPGQGAQGAVSWSVAITPDAE